MSQEIDVLLSGSKGSFELDVEFRVPASGVTVLFGRSGSGKTTLLRALSGLDRMRGHVRVRGIEWQSQGGAFISTERRRLGYVFQEAALFPHQSVRQNLEYARRRAHGPDLVSLEAACTWLGLTELLERRPGTLSGGERQRVAIGRALMASPVLLLMDEPLASLDLGARGALLGHLDRLKDELEIPILYVTHAIEEAVRLADRVLLLDRGRVTGSGSAAEVFGRLDVGLSLGDDAGGIIEASVRRHDAAYHLTELESTWGKLLVPRLSVDVGRSLKLRVRASDVSLALERERQSSILNVLSGVVSELNELSPGQMLVRLTCPRDPSLSLLSRVTRRSADQLELSSGVEVYLRIKSVSVRP